MEKDIIEKIDEVAEESKYEEMKDDEAGQLPGIELGV